MNELLIRTRSIARRAGLISLYRRLSPRHEYEAKFHAAIVLALQPGDVVWDVGANHGFYSKIFCEKTGATGSVIAFEPAPASFEVLQQESKNYPWMRSEQMALGDFDGSSLFVVGESHTTNHLERQSGEANASNSVEVPVMRGDSYWAASGVAPNVMKIDVEGFEEEVLAGMDRLLAASQLRAVFVEVHFAVLEERGRAGAPVRIERLLRAKGLRPTWVDPSHIAATRERA
jgi:FkbM family methyltransferase